ncbi:uncharacterized protein [Heliangelus exortis]|uniref:uncharacterized protein n=1 Tax=Heliangelus exortis TaxID=472823 RepID=UPI003A953B67
MEALYFALEGEISTFVGHVQQCQQGFDLCSLYHVLVLVLPQSPSGQVESWQHLQRLAQHQPSSGSPDVASYVGWLSSYLKHLSMLKEQFDTRVVVPLCENLYVHEELATHPAEQLPLTSIPHLAAQLFTHRRNWGLLLRGGPIGEWVFSPQSLHDLRGFASTEPFMKVLRLVPDVFHQSLATAKLAQQWIHVHRSRYSLSLLPSPSLSPPSLSPSLSLSSSPSSPPSPSSSPSPSLPQQPAAQGRAGLAPSMVQPSPCSRDPHQPGSPLLLPDLLQPTGTGRRSSRVLWAQLQESREELLTLLHHEERAAILRSQIHHVAQRIHTLCPQQQSKGTELSQPQHCLAPGGHWHQAALAEELQKSLELEEYHQSILEGDWMLEMEVRPIFTQRINVVQQRCRDLERILWG